MSECQHECPHESFTARVDVQRIADDRTGAIRNFVAEIQVRCMACDLPFHFVGAPAGFAFTRPTVNVGATTLRAPMAPGEGPLPSSIRFEMQGSNPQ